jgi:hypothetical protein
MDEVLATVPGQGTRLMAHIPLQRAYMAWFVRISDLRFSIDKSKIGNRKSKIEILIFDPRNRVFFCPKVG